MQITKINQTIPQTQSQTFSGRYMINGDNKLLEQIDKVIIPKVNLVRPQLPIGAVQIDDIYRNSLIKSANNVAENIGYGKSWIIQNAKLHGVDLDFDKKNEIFIMSGYDFVDLYNYLKKENSFKEKFKRVLSAFKITPKFVNLPPHLRELDFANKITIKSEQKFYDFVNQKKCEKLNNLEELTVKLLTDK